MKKSECYGLIGSIVTLGGAILGGVFELFAHREERKEDEVEMKANLNVMKDEIKTEIYSEILDENSPE